MNKPIQYFQICSPDSTTGVFRPFEVNQFGETDPFFSSEKEAEDFIEEHFNDSQMEGTTKVEVVLIIVPVFLCRYKK